MEVLHRRGVFSALVVNKALPPLLSNLLRCFKQPRIHVISSVRRRDFGLRLMLAQTLRAQQVRGSSFVTA
jgi:hypothetical protein